jgi:hypothetical protein
MTTVKIKFEGNNVFNNKSSYTFHNPSTNENLNVFYIGKSRIDGVDMFQFDRNVNKTTGHIKDFQYNGHKIKEAQLISALEDHDVGYRIRKTNKDEIIDFLMKQFKIDQYDLSNEGAHISVIRDIKLKLMM